MLEWYEAYADYTDTMARMEALVAGVAEDVLGTTRVTSRGHDVDLSSWRRVKLVDALEAEGLWTRGPDELLARLDERQIETQHDRTWAQLLDHALTSFVEPLLVQPTILNDYPVELSPFARATDEDPTIVERFEWNVNDLVRLVEENSDASPDQAEEWRTYLFFLRQHAAPDGSLPAQFDGLVNDVFGDLLR